jgi:hypothetical protein
MLSSAHKEKERWMQMLHCIIKMKLPVGSAETLERLVREY